MATTISASATGFPGSAVQTRHVRPMRSIHNVKPGETLGSIANMYGLSTQELIANNSHAIGGAGVVHAGMRLEVG